LREASGDSRIGAVVVESTYTSMAGEIEYMFSRYGPISKLAARWTAQLVGGLDYPQLEPEQLVCSLKSRPLLLVYGTGDFDVPASEADRMAAAACDPSSLLMIDADTHGHFMAANANMYSQRLLSFFDAALV
jgi:pimeloyl-ACP methyl ester carboxylesterase